MTGNIALDVTIGLVFVYLLYSLYATILMEILNSFLARRANHLKYSIYRMLGMGRETDQQSVRIFGIVQWLSDWIKLIFPDNRELKNKLIQDFYNQPLLKSLSSSSYSSKPSYLTAQNFSKALMDAIKGDDENELFTEIDRIKDGIDQIPGENTQTKKHLKTLLRDANNDLEKFKLLLEQWYEDTQERAIGWFKRKTQLYLFSIGFILALGFNVDTVEIVNKLRLDEKTRDALASQAVALASEGKDSIDVSAMSNSDFQKYTEKVKTRMAEVNSIIGLEWNWPCYDPEKTPWEILKNSIGILLTALAISLGSPFWFDLLNKLVKLRGAVKIDSMSQQKGNPTNLPKKDDSYINIVG